MLPVLQRWSYRSKKAVRCHCLNLLLQKLFFGVPLEKIVYYLGMENLGLCNVTLFVSSLTYRSYQCNIIRSKIKLIDTYEVVDAPAPISDMFLTCQKTEC